METPTSIYLLFLVNSYPEPVKEQIRRVFENALQRVFEVGIAFPGSAFLLVFLEKEIPLRTELETEFGLKESKTNGSEKISKLDGGIEKSRETREPKALSSEKL